MTRHYLMCRPDHFAVEYAINPWMDPEAGADREAAVRQWETLKRTYEELGHRVSLIDPLEGLPDMVFAANGALVVGGRVYGARFTHPQRAAEGPAYLEWFTSNGYDRALEATFTNEGEGDFLTLDRLILAGTGFRTDVTAHREAQEFLGRAVVTLHLVDPRFYHLDTALFPLNGHNVAYFPGAFSPSSQEVLRNLFPDAVIASEDDAAVLGLNAVSDGRNVVINAEAAGLQLELKRQGFEVIPVDLSELRKAGGGPKCCTLEIRD
ncbi:N-dimethylarginine dimethylaminohydrolase [Streptosporangium becharense]|uniref:N-dimethylarginine dimethylaminohydrolase n=2 Tax=Streptosporangium becharense TaxID=1816182 RepID=A0A7W9IDH0_9ACTN|nr:dimethylargininase [Streptosporangium becharense]MBB2912130.1 N-dimethylarginine dimethylaminohydrolase [Streptosporangium becharense]MBB5818677.1 N-dimethylarginine dimethylaminohydrolase [Streptosporangium becharense]